jgi:cation transport ATPase
VAAIQCELLRCTENSDEFLNKEENMSEEEKASAEQTTSEEQPYRRRRQRQEKPEKHQEKEEKSWDEKWRRDPLNAAVWAIIIIWAGLMFLAESLNLLNWLPFLEPWSLFFLGAGVILALEVGIRLLMPAYRQPVILNVILAAVFLAIGLGEIISWECVLPLAVIALGLYLLFRGVLRRRE